MSDTKAHILVVDDDTRLRSLLQRFLRESDFFVSVAKDAEDARERLKDYQFDLLIVDIMMPHETGLEFLKKLRQESLVPVILLTAMGETADRIAGLEIGADDYLCKPFELEELLARIHVQLRKSNKKTNNMTFKKLTLDNQIYDAIINNQLLQLTRHEYYILELLIKNPKRVFTKQEIYAYAWNDDYLSDDKTINVHISNIRKKISKQTDEDYIKTVWGIGFKMAE